MKYVVLGLILILGLIGQPVKIAGQPMTYDGVVTFNQHRMNGVQTLVTVHIQAREEMTLLALSIRQSVTSCAKRFACAAETLFAGSATQRIAAGDLAIHRSLAWASLHTQLSVFDAVSNASVEIALDLQWSATGDLSPTQHGIGEAFSRDAAVSGLITSPALGTVSLASTPYGTLSRHLGG